MESQTSAWILLGVTSLCWFLGIWLPIVELTPFPALRAQVLPSFIDVGGYGHLSEPLYKSTWSTLFVLHENKFIFAFCILSTSSIIIPCVKLLVAFLVLSDRSIVPPKVITILAKLSTYQLVDLFVAVLFLSFCNSDVFEANVEPGFYFFAAYCILSIALMLCLEQRFASEVTRITPLASHNEFFSATEYQLAPNALQEKAPKRLEADVSTAFWNGLVFFLLVRFGMEEPILDTAVTFNGIALSRTTLGMLELGKRVSHRFNPAICFLLVSSAIAAPLVVSASAVVGAMLRHYGYAEMSDNALHVSHEVAKWVTADAMALSLVTFLFAVQGDHLHTTIPDGTAFGITTDWFSGFYVCLALGAATITLKLKAVHWHYEEDYAGTETEFHRDNTTDALLSEVDDHVRMRHQKYAAVPLSDHGLSLDQYAESPGSSMMRSIPATPNDSITAPVPVHKHPSRSDIDARESGASKHGQTPKREDFCDGFPDRVSVSPSHTEAHVTPMSKEDPGAYRDVPLTTEVTKEVVQEDLLDDIKDVSPAIAEQNESATPNTSSASHGDTHAPHVIDELATSGHKASPKSNATSEGRDVVEEDTVNGHDEPEKATVGSPLEHTLPAQSSAAELVHNVVGETTSANTTAVEAKQDEATGIMSLTNFVACISEATVIEITAVLFGLSASNFEKLAVCAEAKQNDATEIVPLTTFVACIAEATVTEITAALFELSASNLEKLAACAEESHISEQRDVEIVVHSVPRKFEEDGSHAMGPPEVANTGLKRETPNTRCNKVLSNPIFHVKVASWVIWGLCYFCVKGPEQLTYMKLNHALEGVLPLLNNVINHTLPRTIGDCSQSSLAPPPCIGDRPIYKGNSSGIGLKRLEEQRVLARWVTGVNTVQIKDISLQVVLDSRKPIQVVIKGNVADMKMSMQIQQCILGACRIAWDNVGGCCEPNRQFNLVIATECNDNDKGVATLGSFKVEWFNIDDIKLSENILGLKQEVADLTPRVKTAVQKLTTNIFQGDTVFLNLTFAQVVSRLWRYNTAGGARCSDFLADT